MKSRRLILDSFAHVLTLEARESPAQGQVVGGALPPAQPPLASCPLSCSAPPSSHCLSPVRAPASPLLGSWHRETALWTRVGRRPSYQVEYSQECQGFSGVLSRTAPLSLLWSGGSFSSSGSSGLVGSSVRKPFCTIPPAAHLPTSV